VDDNPTPTASRGLGRLLGLLVAGLTAWRTARHREAPVVPPEGPPTPLGGDDPSERSIPHDPRAERSVALLLALAGLCGFAFTVLYIVLSYDTQLLGVAIGACLGLLAIAAIIAGKLVVPQETSVEDRGPLLSEHEVQEVVEMVESGGEGVSRRGLLVGAGGLAGAGLVTAAATPLASLGPPSRQLRASPWYRGVRLVDDQSNPYPADTIQIGSFYTALPEGETWESFGAGLLVIRLPQEMIHLPPGREGWTPQGIMAFSKICTHAGCAISLYRYPLYHLKATPPAFVCPCHYSTFNPADGGNVIFGPAGRALPQLPLMIDDEGNLRAAGHFDEDIGPAWWSVRRA
jgi:ubiquinol-cytochrome c reductase iron-sulfur subunit